MATTNSLVVPVRSPQRSAGTTPWELGSRLVIMSVSLEQSPMAGCDNTWSTNSTLQMERVRKKIMNNLTNELSFMTYEYIYIWKRFWLYEYGKNPLGKAMAYAEIVTARVQDYLTRYFWCNKVCSKVGKISVCVVCVCVCVCVCLCLWQITLISNFFFLSTYLYWQTPASHFLMSYMHMPVGAPEG